MDDLRRAQLRQELLSSELPRVRAEAAAWRNGLGVLLAALVSFGLIKGRSDLSSLAGGAADAVGVLLLLAVLAGAAGALLLLRASFGKPSVVDVNALPAPQFFTHQEALDTARALLAGIVMTLACAALLVGAVATTWYGPPSAGPSLVVDTGTESVCGSVFGVSDGILILDTSTGTRAIRLAGLTSMTPVSACP
jgi:hypothetical protein